MKKIIFKLFAVFAAAVMTVTAAAVPVSADSSEKLEGTEAMLFVNSMGAGWNLGNTFDSSDCTWLSNKLDYESGWCGIKTTKEHIKAVKKMGFSTVRIPVSWHDHVDGNLNIDSAWLNRVAEVADWCLAEDMKVIINIHHDNNGGFYPSKAKLDESLKYVKAIWKQVAEKFKDYDERVIFQALNEPRLAGTNYEWWWPDSANPPVEVRESMECINKLHQAMVDTVRATGGNNAKRYLLVVAYAGKGEIDGVLSPYYKLPTDTVEGRLIVDAHFYGTSTDRAHSVLDGIYNKYIKSGIPAVITEYGADESGTKQYKDDDTGYAKLAGDFFSYARARGISVCIWDDNGNISIFDRFSYNWRAPQTAAAVVKGGAPLPLASFKNIKTEEVSDSQDKTDNTDKTASDKSTTEKAAKSKLKATAAKKSVTLKWDKLDGATKYKVYMYKDGKFKAVKTVKGTSAKITGLKSGKTYKFKVRAYSGGKWVNFTEKTAISVKTKKK